MLLEPFTNNISANAFTDEVVTIFNRSRELLVGDQFQFATANKNN